MAGSMRWRTRSAPSCHQLCVRPVSSRSLAGSLKKIWQETEKTSGSLKPSRSGARKPASTRMSLFSRTTMSFEAARKPALEPPPKPRLAGSARSLTCGKAERTNSALPSEEPLSTTTISLAGLAASAATTEGRNFASRSLAFQVGITAEAQTGGAASAGAARGPRADEGVHPPERRPSVDMSVDAARISACATMWNRSVRASARTLIRTKNGESRSSGSERRKRFRSGMSTGGHGGAEADLVAQLHPAGSTEERDLLGEPGAFLLQTERPPGALVEFPLVMVESFDGLHQRIGLFLDVGGLLPDFGRQVGFDAQSPLDLRLDILFQVGDFGLIFLGHETGGLLIAGQFILQFGRGGAATAEFQVELFGPAVAGFEFGFHFGALGHGLGERTLGVGQPAFFFGDLMQEKVDVALALAQDVGGAGHVHKSGIADLRTAGADGHEEVGIVGRGFAGIDAHFDGLAGLMRLESDSFDMVFKE